mmetsp:Transcript_15911/g.45569  ORF Transcript_15911/g.45569 Transcript_15911/m.45569 type:complete len:342 (-) Transcript_15911:1237-2262(-)
MMSDEHNAIAKNLSTRRAGGILRALRQPISCSSSFLRPSTSSIPSIPSIPPIPSIPSIQSVVQSYTGLSASLFGTTVSQGVYFYFYSLLRSFFVSRRGAEAPSVVESLGIASLAGMANVLLTNPIWVVATRLQTLSGGSPAASSSSSSPSSSPSSSSSPGSTHHDGAISTGQGPSKSKKSPRRHSRPRAAVSNLQVIKSVYADYGIPGFWNGCGASLIMVVNPTIQYAIYEWLMARTQRRNRRAPSTLHVFFCSSVAKAGATLLTYPMLTIKTRMMSARRDQQYRGVGDAVSSIYRREGIRGYFQGIETKILQSILGASVLLMIKEKITMGVKARLLLAGR